MLLLFYYVMMRAVHFRGQKNNDIREILNGLNNQSQIGHSRPFGKPLSLSCPKK